MNTAKKIIAKFGGQKPLAEYIGKGPSTVQYWAKSGQIPTKWHRALLDIAQKQGIELIPSDFLDGSLDEPPKVPTLPEALWQGTLLKGNADIPCYVLDDGRRVVSRTGATTVLTDNKGGGNLESYLNVVALQNYVPQDLPDQMIEFNIAGVVNKSVQGFDAETFLEICRAYVRARDDGALKTDRQIEIAKRASMFISACAKVGLIALIDEATGFQYEREENALELKLRVYLEKEMRQWEKTFPDELWDEFGRLTNWSGSVTQRPKYWGKLINELVYEYLDPDVALWLKENAPKPRHGQNYHQWLTSQFGLKKLMEHLWMLVGMARACNDMSELRQRMAEQYGRQPVQLIFYLPPPTNRLPGKTFKVGDIKSPKVKN